MNSTKYMAKVPKYMAKFPKSELPTRVKMLYLAINPLNKRRLTQRSLHYCKTKIHFVKDCDKRRADAKKSAHNESANRVTLCSENTK